jgi:8-oxo-dGTP pyrophosphatase MutT (NUDIX family)
MPTDKAEEALGGEIARIEAMINSPQMRKMRERKPGSGLIRPRDAATLVLVDGAPGEERVLMGKRHHSLKFMPGALVFPGGSVDRDDALVPAADELDPVTCERIAANLRGRKSARRARALAVAAIREVGEECGILLGRSCPFSARNENWAPFERQGVTPSLSGLRLLARAITPPGPPRRFDTWFFVARADEIGHVPQGGFDPSGELEQLEWIRPRDAMGADTREITRVMLVELMHRLERDPVLSPDHPAPFYHSVRNRFTKDIL